MSFVDALPLTLCGIGTTMKGACDLASGDLSDGAKSLFLGLSATNIGGGFQGLDSRSHSKLMKMTCCAATAAAALQGVARIGVGVRQKNWTEVLRGGVQTAVGIGSSLFVQSLPSKTIGVANLASATALVSGFIAKLGWQDLVKGHYFSGISKVLLGATGVASAWYYAFGSRINQFNQPPLSADQIAFLENHKAEIESMYDTKTPADNWQKLGSGVSKIALVHPDLPEMLVKIPICKFNGFHTSTHDGDLLLHHENLREAQFVVSDSGFDQIAIPHSYLFLTSRGNALVEQRLDLIPGYSVVDSPDKYKAETQFSQLVQKIGLVDLHPDAGHNAGYIAQKTPLQLGIIDFDFKRGRISDSTQKQPIADVCSAAGDVVLGALILGGISEMAKRISNIEPKIGWQYGLGVGVGRNLLRLSPLSSPASMMREMAAGMVAGSVAFATSLSFNTIKSWIKNSLSSLVPKFNSPFAGSIG
jgi:hypothetical protein